MTDTVQPSPLGAEPLELEAYHADMLVGMDEDTRLKVWHRFIHASKKATSSVYAPHTRQFVQTLMEQMTWTNRLMDYILLSNGLSNLYTWGKSRGPEHSYSTGPRLLALIHTHSTFGHQLALSWCIYSDAANASRGSTSDRKKSMRVYAYKQATHWSERLPVQRRSNDLIESWLYSMAKYDKANPVFIQHVSELQNYVSVQHELVPVMHDPKNHKHDFGQHLGRLSIWLGAYGPERLPWVQTTEVPSDMTEHVESSLFL